MSLLSSIQTIVTTLYPDYTFLFASSFNANRDAYDTETTAFPMIVLSNLLDTNDEMQENANILSSENISLMIFDLDTAEATDTESNVIVEEMKTIARRIMSNIWQLDQVRLEEGENQSWTLTPFIKDMNGIYTGVIASSKFKENVNTSICQTRDT